MKLKAYMSKTSIGPLLKTNEGIVEEDLSKNLYAIINSFGGNSEGPHHPTRQIWNSVNRLYSSITDDPDSTLAFFYAHQYLMEGNALVNSVIATHQSILQDNLEKKDMSHRFGASGIFLALANHTANILSIGSCQAYHYSLGEIKLICTEDAMKLPLTKSKGIKSIPLHALGLYDYLDFNFKEVRVKSGDYLILLSSGVYNFLKEDEILRCIEANQIVLENAISEMFCLANDRDNIDNQSCMILKL